MKLTPKSFRFFINLYPPFIFTRTKVKYIAPDWKRITVIIKKSLLTRNYVGTTFGGSLFAATDPFYMIMLIKILGIEDYIVWDQSSEITFIKPARTKVTFDFRITEEQLSELRDSLKKEKVVRPTYWVEGKGTSGETVVKVRKVIYIKRKR